MDVDHTTEVALSLGSNVGERRRHLQEASQRLASSILVAPNFSNVFETTPAYGLSQRDYLNACVVGRTHFGALALLAAVKEIEKGAGRDFNALRNAPRPLDIDILLYGNSATDLPGLAIPHPRFSERPFVVIPLAEIAPSWRHPLIGKTVSELAAGVDGTGVRRLDGVRLNHPISAGVPV